MKGPIRDLTDARLRTAILRAYRGPRDRPLAAVHLVTQSEVVERSKPGSGFDPLIATFHDEPDLAAFFVAAFDDAVKLLDFYEAELKRLTQ